MLENICQNDPKKWEEAFEAGKKGIDAVIGLWDSIERDMERPVTLYEKIGGRKTIDRAIGIYMERNKDMEFNQEKQNFLVDLMCSAFGGPKLLKKAGDIGNMELRNNMSDNIIGILRNELKGVDFQNEEVKNSIDNSFKL